MGDERIYTQWELDQAQRMTRIEDKLDALSNSKSEEREEIEKLKKRVGALDEKRLHQAGERTVYAAIGGVIALIISTFGKFFLGIFIKGE